MNSHKKLLIKSQQRQNTEKEKKVECEQPNLAKKRRQSNCATSRKPTQEGNAEGKWMIILNALQSQRGFGYSKGPSESLPQSIWVDIRINKEAVGTEEMNMT